MQTLQGHTVVLVLPLHHSPKPFCGSVALPGQTKLTNIKLTWQVKRCFGPAISISLLGCFHLTHGCGMFTAADSSNTPCMNPSHWEDVTWHTFCHQLLHHSESKLLSGIGISWDDTGYQRACKWAGRSSTRQRH